MSSCHCGASIPDRNENDRIAMAQRITPGVRLRVELPVMNIDSLLSKA